MKNYIYLSIMILFNFCTREAPLGDRTIATLINNSGHNIEMQLFRNGEFHTLTLIDNNKTNDYDNRGPIGWTGVILPPFSADSIWIIYFNKASIWHTKGDNSPVSKSLMLETSYEGGKTRDTTYEFTYTFTPDDYEEALEFGD